MSEFGIGGTDPFNNTNPEMPVTEPQVVYVDRVIEKHKSTTGYWVTIIILAVLLVGAALSFIIMLFAYIDSQDTVDSQNNEIAELENSLIQSEADRLETEQALQTLTERIGSSFPLIIGDIEIANVEQNNDIVTDYGETLRSSNARYLKPRLKYYGMIDGSRYLKTKWVRPDGTIITGDASPAGFSQGAEYTIDAGANQMLEMGGWGWDEPGNWSTGNYRLEIWFGNTCLKSKSFTVYY